MNEPEPMSTPIEMFERNDESVRRPPPLVGTCDERGRYQDWSARVRSSERRGSPLPPPRCNRTAGHAGPHRVIDVRDFSVRAEWPS